MKSIKTGKYYKRSDNAIVKIEKSIGDFPPMYIGDDGVKYYPWGVAYLGQNQPRLIEEMHRVA